ncbi:MAG: rRNA maturation RNase YbeY [Alphaproteobacteria bacterium]|nr:rRNA maturation RNase YbeY [Alphaproteobacteria bacterium]OJV13573.1 MAG: rRNA maturation RNase YbeY [Alphaproteobacteria bacterium 33-17]
MYKEYYDNFTLDITKNYPLVSRVIQNYLKELHGITETVVRFTLLRRVEHVNISLVLCDDKFIQNLNNIYRNKNKPTNVLSFPQFEHVSYQNVVKLAKDGELNIGDIIISVETVIREAKEQNITRLNHFLHMYVHGLLHLIGYDHMLDSDAEVMEKLETKILGTIGYVPYDPTVNRNSEEGYYE